MLAGPLFQLCSSISQSCSLQLEVQQPYTHGRMTSSSNRGSWTEATHPDARPNSPATLNMNYYANKKSAAESMLDVALLMANASQLKAVLEQGPNFFLYAPTITLISISLCLQVIVGVLLIFIGLVFLIVVVNIFITAFGVHRPNRSN